MKQNNTFNPVRFNLPYQKHRVYDIPDLKKYSLAVQDIYSILLNEFQSSPRYETEDNRYVILTSIEDLKAHDDLSASTVKKALNKLQEIGYINKVDLKNTPKTMIELPKITQRIKRVKRYLQNHLKDQQSK